ncbi:MAG TPA: type II toxin-antitoxin system HicB family antitoxin [Pirellulales bacterium]
MNSSIWVNDSNTGNYTIGVPNEYPKSYRCHLAIMREDEGDFSAVILNLPGTGSCGDTEDEAVDNAREAAVAIIQSYVDDGVEIPWKEPGQYEIPAGVSQKWILVNA